MRKLLLLIALACSMPAAADHLLCLAEDGAFRPPDGCITQTRLAPVPAASAARKFAFIKPDANQIILGTLAANETQVDASIRPMFAFDYRLGGDSDGTIVLTEPELGTWTLTLDAWWFREGRLNVNVPRGTWEYVVRRDGKVLDAKKGITFPKLAAGRSAVRPGRMTIVGRALGADGSTPAAFAEITADCKRVVCTTAADGSFRCETPAPATGALCIEHPRLGRKRVELQARGERIDVGVVQLVAGATIRVVKPLHVELPETATVDLLRKRSAVAEPLPIGTRELVEFSGLSAGHYDVLLAGTGALQKKLFAVEVEENSETEVVLSLDAYRLTGTVEYRNKPLPNAAVVLDGDAWKAELETDQSGRFDAELWASGDYGVSVSASALAQPYVVMKRASPADSHWRFKVPSGQIRGRVFDAESGQGIPRVTLQVESDSEETRTMRHVQVQDDGTFVYSGAGAGRFTLNATASGYVQGEPVRVELRESDGDREVELPLLRGVQVRVTATDSRLQPIAGAAVLMDFAPTGALTRLNRTAADGTIVVTVPEKGTKTIFVVPKESSLALVRLSARDADSGVRVVVPDAVATLRVQTMTTDEEPLPRIGVALRLGGEELPSGVIATLGRERQISTVTNAAGELTIPALPAGDYEVGWRQRGSGRPVGWTKVRLGAGETTVTQAFSKLQ